ncbi:MAG: hypothetical protein IPN49_15045 [Saprospiraceae bacterium]|nr:hypothetical protein [Saprospiraceae bacterium]
MKLKVTIDIFSGRPNPFRIIEGSEAKSLLEKIQLNASLIDNTTQKEPEHLGYRGIIVDQLDNLQMIFRLISELRQISCSPEINTQMPIPIHLKQTLLTPFLNSKAPETKKYLKQFCYLKCHNSKTLMMPS